jgi:hypothetical protein
VATVTVLAVDSYATNAHLILAAHELGHIRDSDVVADVTYGRGIFWKLYRPSTLIAADLKPRSQNVTRADFRCLPWADETLDVVVLDPPYGLRGTVNSSNGGYGLDDGYLSVDARHDLIKRGISECARVTKRGGRVLLKCQAQVCSGRIWWQDRIFADHAETVGLDLIERLDMLGGSRPQPARTRKDGKPSRQHHAYQRPSSLLIFKKTG